MRKPFGLTGLLIVTTLCLSPTALAQGFELENWEVFGRFGFSGGLSDLAGLEVLSGQPIDPGTDLSGFSSTKWNVGGGVALPFTPKTRVRFDVTHTRLLSAEVDLPTSGDFVNVGLNLLEFTGGVEYLPMRSESNVAPFLSAGGGLARIGAGVDMDVQGTALNVGVGDYGGTFNLGAGLLAPVSDRLGLRPEIQFVHITNENFWRASFGFSYRID